MAGPMHVVKHLSTFRFRGWGARVFAGRVYKKRVNNKMLNKTSPNTTAQSSMMGPRLIAVFQNLSTMLPDEHPKLFSTQTVHNFPTKVRHLELPRLAGVERRQQQRQSTGRP